MHGEQLKLYLIHFGDYFTGQQINFGIVTITLGLTMAAANARRLGHSYFALLRTVLAVSITCAEVAGLIYQGAHNVQWGGHTRGFGQVRDRKFNDFLGDAQCCRH